MTTLTWDRWGRGFWRSPCGRFDILEHRDGYTAIDWDLGKTFRTDFHEEAVGWCEGVLMGAVANFLMRNRK